MFLVVVGRVLVCSFVALVLSYVRRQFSSLPPGPLGVPLIGNLLDMPTSDEGKRIAALGKKYGDVCYLKIFTSDIVFLNGAQAALDLLERRGSIYSDRPYHRMAAAFSGMGDLVPLTPFGERFKLERRLMGQALSARAVAKWEGIIVDETHAMLERISARPDEFVSHIRRMGGSLVMMTMYGHRVVSDDDLFIRLANEFMAATTYAITGRWVVDFMPFVKWIPGLAFHRQGKEWCESMPRWVDTPYNAFTEKINSGMAEDSLCASLLYPKDGRVVDPEIEKRVKWIAMSGFGAGSDTMLVSMTQFILAMVLNPEMQVKAQSELDAVVGRHRLPSFRDRPQLRYIECIYKESLRWGVPVPLTIPHRLIRPDIYRDFALPEGTLCIANVWGILHDERVYPDPERFIPERFADQSTVPDPLLFVYGFGRRRCPGIHFADSALWFAMVALLAEFTILPALDAAGREIPVEAKFSSGAIRHPAPFQCRFIPRHTQEEKANTLAVDVVATD